MIDDAGTPSTGDFARLDRSNTSAGATAQSTTGPGKRPFNPLSKFSSYTYQISLYMISPDAYNAFIASDRKNLFVNGAPGTVLVAQSGGINKEPRAAGFELDYYIDNLRIETTVNGANNGTSTNTTKITFQVTEPYGFSFITNLKKAQTELRKTSSTKDFPDLLNASKQFFVMGLRFQGYDASGKVISASSSFSQDTFNPEAGGVFERYYDIMISSLRFTLAGKATVYSIEAVSVPPQVSFGVKNGRLDNGATIVGSTVADAIGGRENNTPGTRGFLDVLNKNQQDLLKPEKGEPTITTPNVYKIRWLADTEQTIGAASIKGHSDVKSTSAPSTASTTDQVTDGTAAAAVPDLNKRTLTFKNDTSVMQTVSNIIQQSSYLADCLKNISKNSLTSTSTNASDDSKKEDGDSTRPLRWYNLSSEVKVKSWDKIRNDFAYEITYIIQPYMTPAIMGVGGSKPDPYYGPHKRYDYMYTGENSEVLRYEQSLDNSFFNVVVAPTDTASQNNNANIPQITNKKIDGINSGQLGAGAEAAKAYVTSLFDPGSWSQVKMKILGDPDYLMHDSPGSVSEAYSAFYGDGFRINPNGGQIFVEVNFNEGVDYAKVNGMQDGLMDINRSIMFWDYPPEIAARVKGVSYVLVTVVSTFSGGKFEQDLTGVINTFSNYPGKQESSGVQAGKPPAEYEELFIDP